MIIEIKIPSPGESITEVEISSWLVENGDYVEKDQEIAEIESDKATLPLIAEESGIIKISAETGVPIAVGTVACTIDSDVKAPESEKKKTSDKHQLLASDLENKNGENNKGGSESNKSESESNKGGSESNKGGSKQAGPEEIKPKTETIPESEAGSEHKTTNYKTVKVKLSPLAKKLMENEGFTIEDILNGLVRISKEDVALVTQMKDHKVSFTGKQPDPVRETGRERMSVLRRKLSQRLVAVKNETAMLTTFNEVDMSSIINIRKTYQSRFTEKHGIKLGFMSFFTRAVTEALRLFPNVNSYIEGEEVMTPKYCDIGIAVQTDKGLMVPVIRNTEVLGLADIERRILELADKARRNRISIEDMTGGTFTITNGGIFGSLLSTPILNPPQSGILGMHNIVERPVAIKGRVEIRPMMYIALSYDHRIIDGRDSVSFLVKVKEILEDPVRMIFGGSQPEEKMLDL